MKLIAFMEYKAWCAKTNVILCAYIYFLDLGYMSGQQTFQPGYWTDQPA